MTYLKRSVLAHSKTKNSKKVKKGKKATDTINTLVCR